MGQDLDASFCKTLSDFYMEKAVQVTENHGDEWGFTWYLRWGIYTSHSNLNPLTKFTSSRGNEFKDILPWNISQIITKTTPISMRIVITFAVKQWIQFIGRSMETETTTWSEFPYGVKAIIEQILASEEINQSKRTGLWDS